MSALRSIRFGLFVHHLLALLQHSSLVEIVDLSSRADQRKQSVSHRDPFGASRCAYPTLGVTRSLRESSLPSLYCGTYPAPSAVGLVPLSRLQAWVLFPRFVGGDRLLPLERLLLFLGGLSDRASAIAHVGTRRHPDSLLGQACKIDISVRPTSFTLVPCGCRSGFSRAGHRRCVAVRSEPSAVCRRCWSSTVWQ